MGPPAGGEYREHGTSEHRVSGAAAGAHVPRRRTQHHLERHLAARRANVRAGRKTQDDSARIVRPICRTVESVRGDVRESRRRVLQLHRIQLDRHEQGRVHPEERGADQSWTGLSRQQRRPGEAYRGDENELVPHRLGRRQEQGLHQAGCGYHEPQDEQRDHCHNGDRA